MFKALFDATIFVLFGIVIGLFIAFGIASKAYGFEAEQEIRVTANQYNVDPDLAVAIATVESHLNPNAIGALGEQGLFQLRPQYHGDTAGNWHRNIRVGIRYLALCNRVCGPRFGSAFFVCFNRGPYSTLNVDPRTTKYFKKVTAALLKQRNRKGAIADVR